MARETLDSIATLKSRAQSLWRTLLFLVLGFLLHFCLPIKIGNFYLGITYTWVIPIGVLLLLLAWDYFRLCKTQRRIWNTLTIAQRRILMSINPIDKTLTRIDMGCEVCAELEELNWFEPPIFDSREIADLERGVIIYRLTPNAVRYMKRFKIKPFHDQTR